ncbi:MAG TPA: PTS sugar transporter subunit IIA [Candidatus Latescibacteria bacterium]|nr:PTS sugar transporter subunit IIA [Candidatus Latescibacterota bacterium]
MNGEFNLSDLMKEELILLKERDGSKLEVIAALVDLLVKAGKVRNSDELLSTIWDRERHCSTGIGRGVAIPHGRTNAVRDIIIAFAKIGEGIDFQALDGKPVHLVFLLVTPEKDAGRYLQALSRLSRLLKKNNFRQRLLQAQEPSEVIRIFREEEYSYKP